MPARGCPETIRIRFLRPEVAFVDVESVPASGSGSRTPCFLVFTKLHGKWGLRWRGMAFR
jgi:hypothetical protein